MKKIVLAILFTLVLFITTGCKTSKSVERFTESDTHVKELSDSTRHQTTITTTQTKAAQTNDDKKTIVIKFEQYDYFTPDSTVTDSSQRVQGIAISRQRDRESDEPPNATVGAVKSYRKGTITINGEQQNKQTSEENTTTQSTTEQKGWKEVTKDDTSKSKPVKVQVGASWWVQLRAFIIGAACALILRFVVGLIRRVI